MHFSAASDPKELKAALKGNSCCKSYRIIIEKVILGDFSD